MALCAFCEENVTGNEVRRGEHAFCSTECADSYFMTYASDGEMRAGDRMQLDLDDFDDRYHDENDESLEADLQPYGRDSVDEDETY